MGELVDVVVPEGQQEGTESTLVKWLKQPGEAVTAFEPLAELETDKVSVEVPAPVSGVLAEVLKQVNDHVAPGDVLARIDTAAEEQAVAPAPAVSEPSAPVAAAAPAPAAGGELRLSPAARRLLDKYKLDASQIPGTGRDGRITHQDIVDYIETRGIETHDTPAANFEPPPPERTGEIPTRVVPLDAMRRRIARHMSDSVKTAPHVTAVFEANMSKVLADRERRKAELEDRGLKLTLTAYFVKAAVVAIKAVPEVNSRFLDDAIELFAHSNIGVGVHLEEKGLIVPVIHRAETLDIEAIAARLQDLTTRARAHQLEPEEVRGGTFTISNHGVTGSLFAAPIIINQPQSAILGIGKLEKRVVVTEEGGRDAARIQPMCYVSLSIDHRVLDGYQTNQFLSVFVEALETWGDEAPVTSDE